MAYKPNQIISKYAIQLLLESDSDQRRTTRYMLQAYIALRLMATEVDGRVFVPDFKRYRLFKFMRDDLGISKYAVMQENASEGHCVAKQSIYTSFDRLKSLGLVSESYDPDFGIICTLPMECFGFRQSTGDATDAVNGFVRIPAFLVSKEYYNLSLRDQKAVLYILHKLYHENEARNINFLSRSERRSDPEGKTEFERIMRICHINRFAHMRQILDRLKGFFHIEELINTTRKTFRFSILDRFRSAPGRPEKLTDAPSASTSYNQTIVTLLRKMLENIHRQLDTSTLISMAKAIAQYDFQTQKAAIDQFVYSLLSGKKVVNPASYLRGIAINLQGA